MVTKLIHIYTSPNGGEVESLCGLPMTCSSAKTKGANIEWCVVCIDIMKSEPPIRYTVRTRPFSRPLS